MKPRNREAVLSALQSIGAAATAAEVATSSSLHIDSARYALDCLVDDGLVGRRAPYRDEGRGARYYVMAATHTKVCRVISAAMKNRTLLELVWVSLS